MFKVGDMAVYPAHGVGVVESIESRNHNGTEQKFYIIRILDNDMIIMVPTGNAKSVGLREIIDGEQIPKVYNILKKRKIEVEAQNWNRRYREYMDKIKTGSVFEVAEVLRDLFILKSDKDLSFGERKMLDTARSLLVKELSIASQMAEDQIEKNIKGLLKA